MQYQILLHGQEVARKNIFSQSWKGRGTELNKERMVLAARQAQQKAKLKQIHMSERIKSIQSFHQKYGSTTRFDNYLNSKDANLLTQHKEQQRQAKMESKIFPGAIEKVSNPTFSKVTGIEAYEFYQESISSDMGQLFVLNFTNQDGRIDFVDQGKRIKVINIERGSVRAFLQLSSQKWQKFELTGSLEFKYLCAEEALKLHIDIKITNPEIQRMMTHIRKLENTKKNGASTPGLKLRRWDKPIVVKPRPLKDVSFIQISNPINALQLAINAYLTHAQDLGAKPKNDYLRDLEIAIRMQATGYSDVDISHSINHASPLVIGKEVHNKYINHLVNVINGPLMKEEWKDVVMKKVQEWTALTNNLLQFNPMTRPKF